MAYNRINWKNKNESATTPLNAHNLNIMDKGIADAHSLIEALKNMFGPAKKGVLGLTKPDGVTTRTLPDGTMVAIGGGGPDRPTEAVEVNYSNYSSGLDANNVQDAVDEVTAKLSTVEASGLINIFDGNLSQGYRTNSGALNPSNNDVSTDAITVSEGDTLNVYYKSAKNANIYIDCYSSSTKISSVSNGEKMPSNTVKAYVRFQNSSGILVSELSEIDIYKNNHITQELSKYVSFEDVTTSVSVDGATQARINFTVPQGYKYLMSTFLGDGWDFAISSVVLTYHADNYDIYAVRADVKKTLNLTFRVIYVKDI